MYTIDVATLFFMLALEITTTDQGLDNALKTISLRSL